MAVRSGRLKHSDTTPSHDMPLTNKHIVDGSGHTRAFDTGLYQHVARVCRLDWHDACAHESERAREHALQFTSIDDEIEHPFLEEKLAALKPLGKFLPNGLFDDARPGKT